MTTDIDHLEFEPEPLANIALRIGKVKTHAEADALAEELLVRFTYTLEEKIAMLFEAVSALVPEYNQ